MQNLIGFGILLILIGFILIILGSVLSAENIKVAAGGFIGPIPFGFFTDKKMFYILLAIFAFLVLFWILFRAR